MSDNSTPYEGPEPYVFVSYSHQDRRRLDELLDYFRKESIRFWYDNGLNSGDDWNLKIALRLHGAAVCLTLLTPSSVDSPHVKNELNHAISYRIPIHSLVCGQFTIPPDVELMIGRFQMIRMDSEYQTRLKRAFPPEVFGSASAAPEQKEEQHPLFSVTRELPSQRSLSCAACRHRQLKYNVLRLTENLKSEDCGQVIQRAEAACALRHPLTPPLLDIQVHAGTVSYYYQTQPVRLLSEALDSVALPMDQIITRVQSVIDLLLLLNRNHYALLDFCKSNLFVDEENRLSVLMLQSLYHGMDPVSVREMDYYVQREIQEIGILLYELCTGLVPVLPCDLITPERYGHDVDKINVIIQKTTIQRHGHTQYMELDEILQDLKTLKCTQSERKFLRAQEQKLSQRKQILEQNEAAARFTYRFDPSAFEPVDSSEYEYPFPGAGTGTLYEDEPTVFFSGDEPSAGPAFISLQVIQTQETTSYLKSSVSFGRSVKADVQINQPTVSRHQASLTSQPDGSYVLQDFGTNHLSSYQGKRITDPVTLHAGDVFSVGSVDFRILPPNDGTE